MNRGNQEIGDATTQSGTATGELGTAGGSIGPDRVTGSTEALPANEPQPAPVQRLPWDFKESFPPPLPEALGVGILGDEDTGPEKIRALHDEQARRLLATLRDMNFIGDARRQLFDPRTGEIASEPEQKKQLRSRLFGEVQRLGLWWQTLIDTYAQAFGEEAADAFAKAIRARNAGIEVIAEPRSSSPVLCPETSAGPKPASAVLPHPPASAVDRKPIHVQRRIRVRCGLDFRYPLH
jgi:hypothetical protein